MEDPQSGDSPETTGPAAEHSSSKLTDVLAEGTNQSRRSVLKSVGVAIPTASFSAPIPGLGGTTSQSAADGRTISIGDFEGSRDGWEAVGPHMTTFVDNATVPAAVITGEQALAVDIRGTPRVELRNDNQLVNVDLLSRPYIVATLVPAVRTETVQVQFRLRGGGPQAHSSTRTYPAGLRNRIYWNLTDVPPKARSRATQLSIEISLSADERQPSPGDEGPPSRGFLFLDGVRVTDDPGLIGRIASRNALRDLTLERGIIAGFEPSARTETTEEGVIEFSRGASVPYAFRIVGDRQYEYTINGETFETGGGW